VSLADEITIDTGIGQGVRGQRIGIDRALTAAGSDADMVGATEEAMSVLTRLGALPRDVCFPSPDAIVRDWTPLCGVEAAVADIIDHADRRGHLAHVHADRSRSENLMPRTAAIGDQDGQLTPAGKDGCAKSQSVCQLVENGHYLFGGLTILEQQPGGERYQGKFFCTRHMRSRVNKQRLRFRRRGARLIGYSMVHGSFASRDPLAFSACVR